MDCRAVLLFCLAVFLAILVSRSEGRMKKVVIHVPYKVKKIKHVHTVYKTVHHHHTHHDHLDHPHHEHLDHPHHEHLDHPHHDHLDHLDHPSILPAEEHEHFHHMHLLEDPPSSAAHSQPIPGIDIPEFLPDDPLDLPLDLPEVPRDIPGFSGRHVIPLYRRD